MINKELIEKLNQEIKDSENKYIEYMNMGHIEAEKIKKAKARLLEVNKVIDYRGFECIVKIDNIKHLSEVYKVDGKHEIYIVISDKLSNSDANKELEYAINDLLPGVVENILHIEKQEAEIQELEQIAKRERIRTFTLDGIQYKDIDTIINRITLGDSIKVNCMENVIDYIIPHIGQCCPTTQQRIKLATIFKLGIMAGKRQDRARRKGVKAIG